MEIDIGNMDDQKWVILTKWKVKTTRFHIKNFVKYKKSNFYNYFYGHMQSKLAIIFL